MSEEEKQLSRRERQIMDIVYQKGEVTGQEVRAALPDPPSYSSVRALLRVLEEKGHLRHREAEGRYIYLPTQAHQSAAQRALQRVVQTFFGGSVSRTVVTLLSESETDLSDVELARLSAIVEAAREREIGDENQSEAKQEEKP